MKRKPGHPKERITIGRTRSTACGGLQWKIKSPYSVIRNVRPLQEQSEISAVQGELNPYAPPQLRDSEGAATADVQIHLVASDVNRTWATRELQLSGDADAILRYEAFGNGERVFVDNELVAQTSMWTIRGRILNSVTDSCEFMLPIGGNSYPSQIDVYASMLMLGRISRFVLTVCGRIVYDEQMKKRGAPCDEPKSRSRRF